MDLGLPVLDGSEATRQIKAAPETKHIPVIALTANAMTGDREKALAAGCDDFDTKPVELPRLLGKIQALVPGGPAIVNSGRGRAARRRRQRGQPLYAHAPAQARGLYESHDGQRRPAGAGTAAVEEIRPGAARHHDARDERVRGARAHEGRCRAAAPAGDHDLGGRRGGERGALHRARRRGLPAQAFRCDAVARAGRREPREESAARRSARRGTRSSRSGCRSRSRSSTAWAG